MSSREEFIIGIMAMFLLVDFTSGGSCQWSTPLTEKGLLYRYTYNLAAPVGHYYHGARSEDGFYKVKQRDASGDPQVFWFQLCEAMEFDIELPDCDQCSKTCGGQDLCGQSCSALEREVVGGYSVCSTVSGSTNNTYAVIDPDDPMKGISVTMSAGDADGCPDGSQRTLVVNVLCPLGNNLNATDFEPPTSITIDPNNSCSFATTMVHPAGCPSRRYIGAWFWYQWLGLFLGIILSACVLYLLVGIIYRTTVHGVSGLDAIPHLDFWRSVHEEASVHVQRVANHAATHVQPVLDQHVHPVLQRITSSTGRTFSSTSNASTTQAVDVVGNETTPLMAGVKESWQTESTSYSSTAVSSTTTAVSSQAYSSYAEGSSTSLI